MTLLERRPYLGGRAFSFWDDDTATEVDNGQHVFMRCCTYYIDLLRRLGALEHTYLQPRLRVPVIAGRAANGRGSQSMPGAASEARQSVLWGAPLPAPFHLLPSLIAYRHLTPVDKARIGPALLSMLATNGAEQRVLDSETFYDWLRRHGQTEAAIERLWNLIVLPTLNADIRRVSAAQALMVFQVGFLRGAHAADIGYSCVGLSRLVAERAVAYLKERGAEVLTGRSARHLLLADGRIAGVAVGDAVLTADCYISALPFHALPSVLPDALRNDPFFRRAAALEPSPIVNVHLWYDRPVTSLAFAAFLDSPVQWVFNRSHILGQPAQAGQYLLISLSGADDYIDAKKETLQALFTAEMARLFPEAVQAQLLRFLVTRERYATFLPAPGTAALRLPQATPVPNLFLAGSWTDTGWPDTMESAVRSGVFAAQAALASESRVQSV